MVESDRQRMIKDSLLEHIIATCVETADAGRLIVAATSPVDKCTGDEAKNAKSTTAPSVDVLRGVLTGDTAAIAEHWPTFTKWLAVAGAALCAARQRRPPAPNRPRPHARPTARRPA